MSLRPSDRAGDADQGEPELGATLSDELAYRLRQQELLAEFGVFALRCSSFDETLNEATRVGAAGMNVELCKYLEYRPDTDDLLMRAGVGWKPGSIGHATLGADLESPAGYAYKTGIPVLSNHLESERRFRTPDLLIEHGVRRALNVPVYDHGNPFGVLEVDSRNSEKFAQADFAFLQGIANIISIAIERDLKERQLAEALERERLFASEMRHRVKNFFAVVTSMIFFVQREVRHSRDPSEGFTVLSERIMALDRASEAGLLSTKPAGADTADAKRIDPIETTNLVLAPYRTQTLIDGDVPLLPERYLMPVALVIHELATNAVKYGALSRSDGSVRVTWQADENGIGFVWSEQGGAEITAQPDGEGFGQKMIRRILRPSNGSIENRWDRTGLTVTIVISKN